LIGNLGLNRSVISSRWVKNIVHFVEADIIHAGDSAPTAEYDQTLGGGFLSAEQFLTIVYQDLAS